MTHDGSRPTESFASTPDWDGIARFLAGESPAEEAARIQQWLEEHPADRELVEHLRATPLTVAADVDVGEALSSVHARMERPNERPNLSVSSGGSSSGGSSSRVRASTR